ncbi:MAG: aldehyde ferredoxin oxidoreductase family protein [Bacillota bacterium]
MHGKLLYVDLSDSSFRIEPIREELLEGFIGGRGLGARLLYDLTTPGLDPFAPESPLIFTVGPFTGTKWPSGTQWSVTAKSPLTKAYGGGFCWGEFGIRMRRSGCLGIILRGRAPKPVSLLIGKNGVEFLDASQLWGKSTRETTDGLSLGRPGCSVACIGQAGERLSGLASIIGDKYQMVLRTGMGAVMGSKYLKAIAIEDIPWESPANEGFDALAERLIPQVRDHYASKRLREQGKPMLIRSKNMVGDLATHNHQRPSFDECIDRIDGEAMKRFTVSNKCCEGCPIGCLRVTRTAKVVTEGPEYEPIWALGPRIGNGDLEYLIDLFEECLADGLDPIGFGGVLAFAMECAQKGLIRPEYELRWGERTAIDRFYRELVDNVGLGGELRNGTKEYYLNHPETRPYAMEVKGVELSGQEPRQSKAFGLSLAVSNWGADWGYGLPTLDVAYNIAAAKELFPDDYNELLIVTSEEHKARLVKFTEEFNAVSDSLGICKFACPETYALMPRDLAEGLSAYSDREITQESLLETGERIINLERMFNMREGLTKEDDYLPERFLREPIVVDLYEGNRLEGLRKTDQTRTLTSDLKRMIQEYYGLRGWPDGKPSLETRRRLELL